METIESIQYNIQKLVSAAFNRVAVNRKSEGWFLHFVANNGGWLVKCENEPSIKHLTICNVTNSQVIVLFSKVSTYSDWVSSAII